MRLTLAEIAQCLCQSAEQIVWQGATAVPVTEADCGKHSVFSSVRVKYSADQKSIKSISAEWAGISPCGAEIDSRLLKAGYIFFCLSGENVDGHSFALQAAKAGACAIIGTKNPFADLAKDFKLEDGAYLPPVFLVDNVEESLRHLAMRHRDTSLAKVVTITGTAGKTSVKEVLAHVLAMRGATAKSRMNRNNQLGLPVSMLQARADSSFWVLEAGISKPNDMEELAEIVRPDIALVLNVGEGHTEGLGDKGVAFYKAKLFDQVQDEGTVVYNADYPELVQEVKVRAECLLEQGITISTFSTKNPDADCFAKYLGMAEGHFGFFSVKIKDNEYSFKAPFISSFGAENVAAIVNIAWNLGFTVDEIRTALSSAELPQQRFATIKTGNFLVIDDSYNANPLSSTRMLDAAQERAICLGLPLYVVFGEMMELGAACQSAHIALGKHMASIKPEVVFWKGDQGQYVRQGLRCGGYQGKFYPIGGGQDFSILLEELALEKGVVLFKGSRSNRLENLISVFSNYVSIIEEANAL